MDAIFFCWVSEIKKQQDYLTRLKEIKFFRRDQIVAESMRIPTTINQVTRIMNWVRNFGVLIDKDAHKYSKQCDILIKRFEKFSTKFAGRIAVFADDEIASDSYDEESGNGLTSSSENNM